MKTCRSRRAGRQPHLERTSAHIDEAFRCGETGTDATIRIVHGAELVADSSHGEDAMCSAFEEWVAQGRWKVHTSCR